MRQGGDTCASLNQNNDSAPCMRAAKGPGVFETVSQFRQAWQALRSSLAQPETEDTWERLEKSLKALTVQLRCVAEGDKRETFEQEVAGSLKDTDFCRDLSSALLTERTRLSGSALDFLAAASCVAGSAFGTCVGLYLPVLLKLLARPNKIYVTRTCNCLAELIHACRHPHILTFLVSGLDDKSPTVRRSCVEIVLEALTGGIGKTLIMDKHAMEKRLGCIEDTIRKGAVDKEVKIRELSRSVWDVYKREWPDRVAEFSQPLTPIIRRYLNLPANAVRPPSPPKFVRPRAASPTRSLGPGAELKRSTTQPPSLKTSKSTSHLAASTGPSRKEREAAPSVSNAPPPRSHPERQPPVIDQLYDSVASSSTKPNPFQQSLARRPGGLPPNPSTAQRSVSAQPDYHKAPVQATEKETPFIFAAPSRPPIHQRPTASRKPGRAVTVAPLATTLPATTSPEGPPPATVRPPSRVLSASARPPAPPASLTTSPVTEEPELPVLAPHSSEEPKDVLQHDLVQEKEQPEMDKKAEKASEPVASLAPPKPTAASSRPALANSTNRAPVASRALKKEAGASAGRAAFKPKRPPTGTAALLGSKGPSARQLAASQSKPVAKHNKSKVTADSSAPKEVKQPPPPPPPAPAKAAPMGLRGSPVKARPKPVAVAASKAPVAKKVTAPAPVARKVQSSTSRRVNAGGAGLGRGTAASDAKAKEAREKRRKREELAGKSKAAPAEQSESAVVVQAKVEPQPKEAPTPIQVPANPFIASSTVSAIQTITQEAGSSSPTKQPPSPVEVPLSTTSDLYPNSLPSPCIKPYLVPLPDTSDSSLYAPPASRLPAPLVLDSHTVPQAEFSFPTSAAQFALATKREAPSSEEYQQKHLPSPNSTLARQFDALQAMSPVVSEASEPEETQVAAPPPSTPPRKSHLQARPSTFHWEEQSLSAFDLPGLANDAEAAETTMITSQGYPGLESPGLEAVRNMGADMSLFGATPTGHRVASSSS